MPSQESKQETDIISPPCSIQINTQNPPARSLPLPPTKHKFQHQSPQASGARQHLSKAVMSQITSMLHSVLMQLSRSFWGVALYTVKLCVQKLWKLLFLSLVICVLQFRSGGKQVSGCLHLPPASLPLPRLPLPLTVTAIIYNQGLTPKQGIAQSM